MQALVHFKNYGGSFIFMKSLDMNLQFFAEPTDGPNSGETGTDEDDKKGADVQKDEQNGHTDEEIDRIVKNRVAREREKYNKQISDFQAQVDELKKQAETAKMTADQKKQYEAEQAKKQAEEATAKLKHYELRDRVRSQLADTGLNLTDAELELVTTVDEETTETNVEIVKGLYTRIAEQVKNELLKGDTPKTGGTKITNVTPEQFNEMSSKERAELYNTNPDLFNKLTGGM